MQDRFNEIKDDIEFALAGAIAHLDEIMDNLDEMANLAQDPTELERVQGELRPAATIIESIAARFGRIDLQGSGSA